MRLSNIEVKKQNRINVFKTVIGHDKVSRQEIAALLSLSLPTVGQNIKELIALGLAAETGELVSTGGRRASSVSALPDSKIGIGLDITQNHVGLAASNLKGEVLAHVRFPQKFANTNEYYQSVANLTHRFIAQQVKNPDKVLGIGVSLPGIVSHDGKSLQRSHLLNIQGPTKISLFDCFDYEVRLCNDASAASMAELSVSPDLEHMVYLSLSNSVGGAIILNRAQVEGNNLHSAEFGHATLFPGGKTCYCGKQGHFDSYGSALSLTSYGDGRLENFFFKLESKDPLCMKVFAEYLDNLVLMIGNIRVIFDCDIVLGGYVGSFLTPYLPEIMRGVEERDTFAEKATYLRTCRYKIEASAVGASLHFIESFIQNI
ncbi:MAG: ROK family transcriptional regulator [Spirochaetia bacterium]|jgi:predicted NBD/HSP70 family sugar kinase|nr:ROK family transcriptional regulator [Spirochaetia bacterium]